MNANALIRSIFGFSRCNIQPLVEAVEIAYELLFIQGKSRDSIQVTKDIYVDAAKRCQGKQLDTIAREIERLCHRCWGRIQEDEYLYRSLIGTRPWELSTPSEVIFLLACRMKYKKPFQEVLEREEILII